MVQCLHPIIKLLNLLKNNLAQQVSLHYQKLRKLNFPTYNTQMLIGFMTHLDFCRKWNEQKSCSLEINKIVLTDNNENEVYYFFPALVNVDCPIKSCLSIVDMKEKKYKCGWCLCCPSGKFLHQDFYMFCYLI